MRATRNQGERVQIDLIDVDPIAFDDGLAGAGAHTPDRWRQALTALAVVGVSAGAAVAWWPQPEHPQWRIFQTAPVPAAGLTAELVFDQPPGRLLVADLAPPPVDVKPELGYVFGELGGTVSTRRWATFRTRVTNDDDVPAATTAAQVDGVDAEVQRIRIRHNVSWGPVAGRTWVVTTNNFDEAQSLDFANQVGVVDGDPALAYDYQLAGMQPIGSVAALDCVELLKSLFLGERGSGAAQPTLLTWGTPGASVSLGSIAAPVDALPLVDFVLGAGRPITIHGLAATVITSRVLSGPVVAWVEDGRLIMVAGHATADELIVLAESVRPATDGEWRRAGLTDIRDVGDVLSDFSDSVAIYRDVNPMTDDELAVTVQLVDDKLFVCVQQRSNSHCETSLGNLPLLTTIEASGQTYVVAMVDRSLSNGAEVRIKIADGTWTLPVQDFGTDLPGPAVAALLPIDHGVIELWNNGEVAAAI